MQQHMAMTAIGFGHARSAFEDVNKPVPADLRSTVRNMKKQKTWLNRTTPDAIQVTTIGESYVARNVADSAACLGAQATAVTPDVAAVRTCQPNPYRDH